MQIYKDMIFCLRICDNLNCPRNCKKVPPFTDHPVEWGSFLECEEYYIAKKEEQKSKK